MHVDLKGFHAYINPVDKTIMCRVNIGGVWRVIMYELLNAQGGISDQISEKKIIEMVNKDETGHGLKVKEIHNVASG